VFQSASVKEVKYPLTSCQKMAMMRNIEKMITDALNDHREVICQLYAVRSVSDVTVTYKFLLSGDSQPRCEECKCSLTVKHFLLECCSLKDVREKYFTYSSLFGECRCNNNHGFYQRSQLLSSCLVIIVMFPFYISYWSFVLLSVLYHSLLTSSICYCI